MTAEEWQQIRPILESALQLEGKARERFLEEACAEATVRREVESLLAAHGRGGTDFLESPANPTGLMEAARFRLLAGRRIGPYEIQSEIALGGMGAVYSAIRADGQYKQKVALKILRAELGAEPAATRFRNERQILASLEHPNIAKILDGGTASEGLPYLVMELIEGLPITEYCDQQKLPIEARLRLFRSVCSAVHCAHQHLVIHRDIKPNNILVIADGVPKLLDFGIAKILDPSMLPGGGTLTAAGAWPMTPEYASPEQIRGESVTTAADVYSLGVVLYELLTGHMPYRLRSRSPHEISRAVCETEPERPSTAISRQEDAPGASGGSAPLTAETVSAARQTQPEKLRRLLSGDLEQIVLKAIRKEPQLRYASAEQLAEDVRRYEEGLPVVARKGTFAYRSRKYMVRHRAGVAAAVFVAVSLLTGFAVAVREARIARANAARAERHFDEVRKLANSLVFEVYDSIKDTPGTTAARKLIIQRARDYLDGLAKESSSDASLLRELAAAYGRLADVEGNYQQANLGETPRALQDYREALALSAKASSLEPSNREMQRELAQHYLDWSKALSHSAGKKAESKNALQESLKILEPLAAASPQDSKTQAALAAAYAGMGSFLRSGGDNDFTGALEYFRKALAIFERLAQAEPGNGSYQTQISAAHRNIGGVLAMQKNWAPALDEYRIAVRMDEAQLELHPDARSAQEDLSVAYSNTGFILVRQRDLDGGLDYYLKALMIRTALAAADPKDTSAQMALSNTYNYLGGIYWQKGDLGKGIELFKKALALREGLLQKDPANDNFRFAVATSQQSIGRRYTEWASRSKGVPSKQLGYCREAVTWMERAWPVFVKRKTEGRQEGAEVQDLETIQHDLETCRQTIARLSRPSEGP